MSDKTDALYQCLLSDFEGIFDPYQFAVMAAGGVLWPDATVTQARCFYLARALFKKYNEEDQPSTSACKRALEKFITVNNRCASWELNLESTLDEVLLGGVKRALWEFWNKDGYDLVSSWDELFASGGLGQGQNVYARGSDLYTKLYDSRLTYTSESLLFVWQKLVSRDHRWLDAERQRSNRHGAALVAGNKLSFVNKNVDVARTICTEPTINMWFQLGMGRILESRLSSYFGIDISSRHDSPTQPEINGALAREGSRTKGYATIDLESASDSMSLSMLAEILPANMLAWLMRLRSPYVGLPGGSEVKLEMVSSMGNGFTFPLQTAVFSACVSAVYASMGYSLKKYGRYKQRNFGVFGDDIIVKTECAQRLLRILRILGFVVNADKSFIEGPFRESCGQDYYNGLWCRGVYIKRLDSPQSTYVAINALVRWSAVTGVRIPNAVSWLVRSIRGRKLMVPPDEPDDAGIHVPLDRARGVKHLQHGVMTYNRSIAVGLHLDILPDGSLVCEHKAVTRHSNPNGLLLCFLHGSVRGYRISLRQRRVRYTTRRRVTTMWNTLSPVSRALHLGWRRWSDAAYWNLPQ